MNIGCKGRRPGAKLGVGGGANILLPSDIEPLFDCDSARNPAHIWTELSRILISIASAMTSEASEMVQNSQHAFENKSEIKLCGFLKIGQCFLFAHVFFVYRFQFIIRS